MRFVKSFAAALVCASVAVHAQDKTKTTTKVEGNQKGKTVSYIGCLGAGTETQTYMLDKVVPVTTSRTTEVAGTGGTMTTTSTSYVLVPGEKVMLQQHVGHKVEVTGMLIPAGETKTTTKIEREHGADSKSTTKTETDHPQFRVMSVKELAEPCM